MKKGVKMDGAKPPILYAMGAVDMIFRNFLVALVVTSVVDGPHKEGSKHNEGLAFDVRTRHIVPQDRKDAILRELRVCLDSLGFDVVLEPDHIHIEYDPKGKERVISIVE
jgi:hypothetical protein